jgi:hypothetical protein
MHSLFRNVKVKYALVEALRHCTGRTAHRRSRGTALPFLDHSTRRGWVFSVTSLPLFTPGKTRYPLYRRLGGPQGRSGQVQKTSPPSEFDIRTVQPVASRYTAYATRPTLFKARNKFLPSVHVVIQINPSHNSTTSASKTRSIVSYYMLSQYIVILHAKSPSLCFVGISWKGLRWLKFYSEVMDALR